MSGPHEEYVLGIDLGTTSVKVAVVDRNSGSLIVSESSETKANIYDEEGKKFEQSVIKIFDALDQLLTKIPGQLMSKVCFIGVSGQMHGVVMWKHNSWIWDSIQTSIRIAQNSISNLITWQDQRCSQEFLETLPDPGNHDKLNSGFGLPTMIWLQRNQPIEFKQYHYCGTIQDLLVAILTGNTSNPLMSDQNASGWGYYDPNQKNWTKNILKSINFPIEILPIVKSPEYQAGKLISNWRNIPENTRIGVALGDLEASVLSIFKDKQSDGAAVINISSSIQLTFIMPNGFVPSERTELDERLEYRPYFGGRYLAVGAGLNGGNCLAFLVLNLKSWIDTLGCQITADKIWETLLKEGETQLASDLRIEPTLHGERYSTDMKASIGNIDITNMSLGHVMRATCNGIIRNLRDIISESMLSKYGVNKIWATGSALIKNRVLQDEIRKQFEGFQVEVCDSGDAAYGAALVPLIINDN